MERGAKHSSMVDMQAVAAALHAANAIASLIESGVIVGDIDRLAEAGISAEQVNAWLAAIKAAQVAKS